MRRAFEAAGAPSPRSFGAEDEKEALRVAGLLRWPIIVKPSRNSGSRGVTRLADRGDRAALLAAFLRALGASRDGGTVIEEFVDGPEFSVEIVVWDWEAHVLAVTDKRTTGAPFFVETGHSQPSVFTGPQRQAVRDAAVRGVKALGINWSAAHAEVRLSPQGPFLMEIGARLGGDFITTDLVPLSTGIDMVAAAIQLALGEEPSLSGKTRAEQGAAIRYLTPRSGMVTSISGVEQAKSMPGVRTVELGTKVGELVPELAFSLSRVGHIIATGATAEEAIARAEAARDTVRIVAERRQVGTERRGRRTEA
jgi:biotin carboxylase